ncbi:hypothetical protein GQR58_029717 [Nymphon striatum]|nr:hypothetical protein GQR58_029717 [Nymphon striatum]
MARPRLRHLRSVDRNSTDHNVQKLLCWKGCRYSRTWDALRSGAGEIKRKSRPKAPKSNQVLGIVVWCGNVSDFLKRNRVIVIIFQNVVTQIRIILVVVVEYEIFVFCVVFVLLGLGISSVGNHCAGLTGFDNNNLTSVRADDRIGVQVVEPFSGFRAEALSAPLFLWHVIFLLAVRPLGRIVANCHKDWSKSKAFGAYKCERRIWDV